MLYFVLNEMQYIFSQEEYEEYMYLKSIKTKKRNLSNSKEMVYKCYINNPWITYENAASLLWMHPSWIYKHIVSLEKMWYVERDTRGWVHIIKE